MCRPARSACHMESEADQNGKNISVDFKGKWMDFDRLLNLQAWKWGGKEDEDDEGTGSWGVNNVHITASTDLFLRLAVSASRHCGSSLPTKVGVVSPESVCMRTSVCTGCLHRIKACLSKQKRDSESMVCARVAPPSICNQVCVCTNVYTAHW